LCTFVIADAFDGGKDAHLLALFFARRRLGTLTVVAIVVAVWLVFWTRLTGASARGCVITGNLNFFAQELDGTVGVGCALAGNDFVEAQVDLLAESLGLSGFRAFALGTLPIGIARGTCASGARCLDALRTLGAVSIAFTLTLGQSSGGQQHHNS